MIKEHFYITPSIRKGTFVVLVLAMSLHIYNYYIFKLTSKRAEKKLLDLDIKEADEKIEKNVVESILYFDPNMADSITLSEIGLSPFVIGNLIKLRSTGWRAEKANDLLKVYGMNESILESIDSNIKIKRPTMNKVLKVSTDHKRNLNIEYNVFDPNDAHEDNLRNLGFNAHVIRSITNFRSKGGRFYEKQDLLSINRTIICNAGFYSACTNWMFEGRRSSKW